MDRRDAVRAVRTDDRQVRHAYLGLAAFLDDGDALDPALVARVIRLVDLAEYKRRQYPPGPKITVKNFGRDRRLPITDRWRESLPG